MADIDPPSFSLGLDFDFDPSPNSPNHINPVSPEPGIKQSDKGKEKQNDDEFELRVSDSAPESPEYPTRTRFRRLRRGGPSFSKPISTPIGPILSSVDDDIEDFSDEENGRRNDILAPKHHSSCSSSKLPLSGCGVLMRPQKSSIHDSKGKQDPSCPSTSLGTSKGKIIFSELTASPLRRFQLLDSESDPDEPSIGVCIDKEASRVDSSITKKQKEFNIQAQFELLDSESDPDDPSYDVHVDRESREVEFSKNNEQKESNHGSNKMSLGKNRDLLRPISQKQDLWKDFCGNEKCSVQTPAFDEICEEYFKSMKSSKPAPGSHKLCPSEQEISMNNAKNISQPQVSGSIVPPSHHYYFHDDLRIQRLIRSRLPYFCPLSTSGDAGRESLSASSIDYMCQFGEDGVKQKPGRQVTPEKSSGRGRKKTRNSSVEDTSLGAGDWINPKNAASTPKDAGRRRVHADGQSAGRWFTAENGVKVYVTGSGEQLTGKQAFKHYRKATGRGFKKYKKKSGGKKK